mmetsp:Transcript_21600/g.40341  ORF Transcript_21600/g.40341 Transcript_21600/m.40341 type:complete len:223 (+) Transcript_21600:1011-1679(+)
MASNKSLLPPNLLLRIHTPTLLFDKAVDLPAEHRRPGTRPEYPSRTHQACARTRHPCTPDAPHLTAFRKGRFCELLREPAARGEGCARSRGATARSSPGAGGGERLRAVRAAQRAGWSFQGPRGAPRRGRALALGGPAWPPGLAGDRKHPPAKRGTCPSHEIFGPPVEFRPRASEWQSSKCVALRRSEKELVWSFVRRKGLEALRGRLWGESVSCAWEDAWI